jgi:hypothetical protein
VVRVDRRVVRVLLACVMIVVMVILLCGYLITYLIWIPLEIHVSRLHSLIRLEKSYATTTDVYYHLGIIRRVIICVLSIVVTGSYAQSTRPTTQQKTFQIFQSSNFNSRTVDLDLDDDDSYRNTPQPPIDHHAACARYAYTHTHSTCT